MARLLLGTSTPTQVALSTASNSAQSNARPSLLSPAQIEARLRAPRSAKYLAAMTALDAGSHAPDPRALQALMDILAEEFPELEVQHHPLGIVAKCYLDAPYEVHTLDASGRIIQHYKTFQSLPSLLEPARSLALNPAYLFVEVYTDKMIPVDKSGFVAIVGTGVGNGGAL